MPPEPRKICLQRQRQNVLAVGHSVDWLQAACGVKDFSFIGILFGGGANDIT